ncbi:uncharacterized protein LOC119349926 [Triticum dicoccoides]|uniref:uncharacterized protein LOC119349926 n=1 Tax=Triticum dicoccoides TaxID=85692 RepID=UPI00188F2B42|nr:uncharacterized protein LOC119349926 [Triticum dicoccoides]
MDDTKAVQDVTAPAAQTDNAVVAPTAMGSTVIEAVETWEGLKGPPQVQRLENSLNGKGSIRASCELEFIRRDKAPDPDSAAEGRADGRLDGKAVKEVGFSNQLVMLDFLEIFRLQIFLLVQRKFGGSLRRTKTLIYLLIKLWLLQCAVGKSVVRKLLVLELTRNGNIVRRLFRMTVFQGLGKRSTDFFIDVYQSMIRSLFIMMKASEHWQDNS